MSNLVIPAARLYPRTQFVHVNYVYGQQQQACDRAISYSFACAKLWNQVSFVAPPDLQKAIHDDIYFGQLGSPLTASYEEDPAAGVAWRRFQNAVVAINSSDRPYPLAAFDLLLDDPPRGYVFWRHSS
jgi:hypothetical protein